MTHTKLPTLPHITLVLGGAGSGKSVWAETLIERNMINQSDIATYIATAEANDAEMIRRIIKHRDRRGNKWHTVEEPLELVKSLQGLVNPAHPILIDCLTLWLSNLMLAKREVAIETHALSEGLRDHPGPVVLVSNEVGLSIVPENSIARQFRDYTGCLNQQIASIADQVILVVAGLPITLK